MDNKNYGASSFTEEVRKKYLDFISQGYRLGSAASACGISARIIQYYIKANPEFKDEVNLAEMEASEVVENALMEKILIGKHYPAMVFWLCNRAKERWKDPKKVELEHLDTGNDEDNKILKEIIERTSKRQQEQLNKQIKEVHRDTDNE